MKEITKILIKKYMLNKLKIDMLGFAYNNIKDLSYHHAFSFARSGGKETVENGAALDRNSGHDLIHIIEYKDFELFSYLTSELYDVMIKGRLDKENLLAMDDLIQTFFCEHRQERTKKGKKIITDIMKEKKERGNFLIKKL